MTDFSLLLLGEFTTSNNANQPKQMKLSALIILLPAVLSQLVPLVFHDTEDTEKEFRIQPIEAEMPFQAAAGGPTIADVIPIDRSLTIYSDLVRTSADIQGAFGDAKKRFVVLAPQNSAIVALGRKPWDDRPDDTDSRRFQGQGGEDRAQENIMRFVQAHILTAERFDEGDRATNLLGEKLYWKRDADGKKRIYPGGIAVVSERNTAVNGDIWVLDGVING